MFKSRAKEIRKTSNEENLMKKYDRVIIRLYCAPLHSVRIGFGVFILLGLNWPKINCLEPSC